MWHLCERKRKASIEKGYRSSSGMKSSPGAQSLQFINRFLLTHCIHRLRAPFNTFACWHFFNTQLWSSFPTVALNQEIKPIADFRKDVFSPCPCHSVFHRGKGHCTKELSTGMENFVSSLLRKSSWHSSGVFSHPKAQLPVKLGSQTDGHGMQVQTEMAGWGPALKLCTSFKFVKKKTQSLLFNNLYKSIYFSSSHFAFCLSLVSKHWDWLMAFLEVPFISTGVARTILSSFSSEHVTLQKTEQTSSQSLGLAGLAQTRFLKMQVQVQRHNKRAVKKLGTYW